jgi:diaminopimelate epimerase
MMYFEKYHGTGNDFIILNATDTVYENPSEIARAMCDRHFGVGADGLMFVLKSTICDVKMDFYNADGTVAPMCGNGIRCFTKYVYDQAIVNKPVFTVETLAGIMKVAVTRFEQGGISQVRVNMGKPIFNIQQMDVISQDERIMDHVIQIDDQVLPFSVVTMGTLHCVIFVKNLDQFDVEHYGQLIESHPMFPKKINVNFTEIIDQHHIKVRTYERGVGLTLSCGTGSAASAVVANRLKGLGPIIHVHVLGGTLMIEEELDGVYLNGPANLICNGYFNDVNENRGVNYEKD